MTGPNPRASVLELLPSFTQAEGTETDQDVRHVNLEVGSRVPDGRGDLRLGGEVLARKD